MARVLANDNIRDTNTHTYDHTHLSSENTFQYVNNLDQIVDVVVKATYESDNDFSDAVTLASYTGSNGLASDSADYDTLSNMWDKLRFEVTAQSPPSNGAFLLKQMCKDSNR